MLGAGLGIYLYTETRPRPVLDALPPGLAVGDVVLMESHTWRAALVRLIDGQPHGRGFSHVGVVHDTAPPYTLLHAVPGAGGTVRLEPWPSIAAGGGTSRVEIWRPRADVDADTLQAIGERLARRAVPFDADFDHHDPDALYCTELVTHLYQGAGAPLLDADALSVRALFPADLTDGGALRQVHP